MRLLNIVKKTNKQGIRWLLLRCIFEIKNPSTQAGKILSRSFRFINSAYLKLCFKNNKLAHDAVTAIYDLNVDPATFDVACFIIGAEMYAIENNISVINFVLVRKKSKIFSNPEYESIIDDESQKWRINNVILPVVSLHPLVKNIAIVDEVSWINMDRSLVYPKGYSKTYTPRMDYPEIYLNLSKKFFNGFKVSAQSNRYVNNWIKKHIGQKRLITVTIRYYEFDKKRNSNIKAWVEFSQTATDLGYEVVFLLDNETCWDKHFDELRGHIFREGTWNLELRMALYQHAVVNFFKSNGPGGFTQLFKDIPYISFHPVVSDSPLASEKFYRERNMPFGKSKYDFATNRQMLVWESDTYEIIYQVFNRYRETNEIY